MEFGLDPGQVELQQTVERFFADRFPLDGVGDREGAPVDRGTWGDLAAMGLFGLVPDDDAGGSGLGVLEAALAFEQVGSYLVPGPLLWTVLAGTARRRCRVRRSDRGWDRGRGGRRRERRSGARPRPGRAPRRRGRPGHRPSHHRSRRHRSPWRRSTRSHRSAGSWASVVARSSATPTRPPSSGGWAPSWPRPCSSAWPPAPWRPPAPTPSNGTSSTSRSARSRRSSTSWPTCTSPRASPRARPTRLLPSSTIPGRMTPADRPASAKLLAADAAINGAGTAIQVLGGMGFTWDMLPHYLLKRAWVLEQTFGSADDHALRLGSTLVPSP